MIDEQRTGIINRRGGGKKILEEGGRWSEKVLRRGRIRNAAAALSRNLRKRAEA